MVYWLLSSFVSATLQVLLEKLTDFGVKTYESISDVDEKLQKLRRTLMSVESSIRDAEDNPKMNMAWQVLLLDLEKVAYDADDLIDEIAYKVSKLEDGKGKNKNQVNKLLLSLYKHTSAAPNMNDIQAKLDGMLRELESLCVRERGNGRHLEKVASKLQTSSLIDESHVFGREIDKMNIIKMLVPSEESSRAKSVSIIPIVGMIGVGKTTLAQIVYNHNYQETEESFNLKMWVSITKDFDVMRLTRCIIEAATRESTSHLLNLESLQVRLTEILHGKKFLLVLDDLWNVKKNEWNLLLKPLKHGLRGSKIIVTTGSTVVSSLVGTTKTYDLKCLSDQACFSLLMEEALGDINLRTTSPELEEIGKQIAMKCKGLPLAAKIVGSLLQSKVDQNAWNNILDSRIWDSSVIKNEIVPALKSGYHHLPSHVRQCFAYCSMFPQSYDFEKIKLVRMWMGEGFVIPDKERTMIENIGNDYFDQLSQKSFFQMEGGRYMIHDAVHNLSQAISCEKFFRMEEVGDSIVNSNTRHLSIVCEKIHTVASEVAYRCKGLRTFLLLGAYKTPIKEVHFALFMELRSLRVLDLSGTQVEDLAESIGNLKHLRFLDLSNTLLKWLPETMQELCLLQTLRLRNCLELLYLPKNISGLKSLQHLELDGNYHLTSMPSGIGKLTGLQTVSEFIVGPGNGQMKELKHMNNIRGSLRIKQLEKVKNPQDALEANLANKKYLDKLELQWTCTVDSRVDEHVLDKLIAVPLKSLKELILTRYGGRMFPTWVCDPLFSQLTAICFDECKNCGLLPPLGQLPKLKSLKIVGMHELKKVDQVFQKLETLELRDMPKLEGWVGVCDNDMPLLRELTIVDCPQMRTLPSLHYFQSLEKMEFESCPLLPSLSEERLSNSSKSLIIRKCVMLKERCEEDGGEDWTKIEHIPYIEINYKIVRELQA